MSASENRLTDFRIALARLDIGTQKTLFRGFGPEMRAALWQDRLSTAKPDLKGVGQAALVDRLLEFTTPENYAQSEKRDDVRDAILKIGEEAAKVFDDYEVYNDLTTRLGEDPCDTTVIAIKAPPPPDCTCSSVFSGLTSGRGNDCAALTECKAGNCTAFWPGCGALFLWSCDGLCTGRIVPG